MKIKVDVCEVCRKERCDGKTYRIKDSTNTAWYAKIKMCKNSPDVVKRDGKLYYHWVMGHGIEDYLELEKI